MILEKLLWFYFVVVFSLSILQILRFNLHKPRVVPYTHTYGTNRTCKYPWLAKMHDI